MNITHLTSVQPKKQTQIYIIHDKSKITIYIYIYIYIENYIPNPIKFLHFRRKSQQTTQQLILQRI